ncbi:MAG: pyridoxamine 5'-phosphate oxidase family protein [Hyphomicrobiales bacterium]|nr:pyridoxamine 5'-phosphate oxidase family protein [Hyphomicrobiales bacterium]
MFERAFFHDGMIALQEQFDGRRLADRLDQATKHYEFSEDDRKLIEAAPFFFIASAWGEYVDCSIKAGDPGFVKIVGPGVIEYPEYDGNSTYRTLGNISKNSSVGLLFMEFDGKTLKLRANGRATVYSNPETLARHYGAKLVVRIECEIYPNCPRYAPSMKADKPSIYPPRPDAPSPIPEWKRLDIVRDVLPQNDPHADEVNRQQR